MTIPLNMSQTGAVPTSPVTLLSALLTGVAATNPGYTANLPGSLIEDISSTCVGALATIDQARVDAVNSVSPYLANPFILAQLGTQFGISQGQPTNTSVQVVFSGPAGYVIPNGFIVGDGTYEYVIQDSAVVQTNGTTISIYAIANSPGTWSVGVGTVTKLLTSVPVGYTLTVTNPAAGIPALSAETVQSYRSRVLKTGQAMAQGVPTFLTSSLLAIPGVTPRLVTVLSVASGWEVICGGGDPYAVAGAIYSGVLALNTIVGSATTARNITVSLTDVPNTYSVTYVNPPQQVTTITATWNTDLPNFVSASLVNSQGAVGITNYINSIPVGSPINELEMTSVFQNAIANILPVQYLSSLTFAVYINGTLTAPNTGTSIIPGDPESYFYASATGITVVQ